jgi:hypothetical protein
MKNIYHSFFASKRKLHLRGFVLPFTMLISVLVLFITTSALALLSKQQYFSRLYKQSQSAYYAADDAMACAMLIDDTYVAVDGLGLFPSSIGTPTYIVDVLTYMSSQPGAPTITMADIKCGQSPIFVAAGSPSFDPQFITLSTPYLYHFINPLTGIVDTESGQTSTYNMQMDLGFDPADVTGVRHLYRCAKVTVNKTPSFRQVVAQGYSTCGGSKSVERAVVNTTITQ